MYTQGGWLLQLCITLRSRAASGQGYVYRCNVDVVACHGDQLQCTLCSRAASGQGHVKKATAADVINKQNSPSLIDWDVIVREFQLGACLQTKNCRPFHPSLLLTIAIHEDITASKYK